MDRVLPPVDFSHWDRSQHLQVSIQEPLSNYPVPLSSPPAPIQILLAQPTVSSPYSSTFMDGGTSRVA